MTFYQKWGATYFREIPINPNTLRPGVSHPLDAFFPPRPPELISSRIRPWGSPFEALFLPNCRTPSQTPSPHAFSAGRVPFPVYAPDPMLQGIHSPEVPPKALRFRQEPLRIPPWDSSPTRLPQPVAPSFKCPSSDPLTFDNCRIPSRDFSIRSQADLIAVAPGF